MRMDSEGVELDVRTAFGRAQVPALLLFCLIALGGLGVAILAMQTEERSRVETGVETREIQVSRSALRKNPIRLGPSHEAIVNRGWDWYRSCRAHQLLDTPADPFAGTVAPPGSSHLPLRDLVDHVMRGGLPTLETCGWNGTSAPLSVPSDLWDAGQRGTVDNPFYPEGIPITVGEMGDAFSRLQPLLEREWEGLVRGYPGVTSPDGQFVTTEVPVVVTEVITEPEVRSLQLALAAAATSVLSLLMLLALAMLPVRVRVAFGLRGVAIGRRSVSAQDVASVDVMDGRLVVTGHDGSITRSPKLESPQQLEPFVDQYRQLTAPVPVEDSPQLDALRSQHSAKHKQAGQR